MYENWPKFKELVLFYETYLKETNINWKPLSWSQNKIITKFGQNKWVSLVFRKIYENCLKIKKKVSFYETYFEESNINRKPLIWSQDKIIKKFRQKKWESLILGNVYENCSKIKEKYYFTKPNSRRIISNRNPLFGSKIR